MQTQAEAGRAAANTVRPCQNGRMSASAFPSVAVSGEIKLGQFLKLAGLVEDGAEARIAIQSGDVMVNGEVETRRGHRLVGGDVVVVDLPTGAAGAVVIAAPGGPVPTIRSAPDTTPEGPVVVGSRASRTAEVSGARKSS